ncbi:MAG: flavodoxin domain-containing protein [Mucilaginibacter sp.]
MNGIIIYQGKYGATEQYAKWLAESVRLPLLNIDAAIPVALENYDFVLLGSSVYVGKFTIRHWLRQNLTRLAGKKIFFFIVCGTPGDDKAQQDLIIKNNVDPVIRNTCKLFFLPGRVIVSKLSWKDWFLLKMGAMLEKNPQKKAAMNRGYDRVDKKYLADLVRVLKAEQITSAVAPFPSETESSASNQR